MFGYVVPDKPNMFMKDYYEYRAYYCGLCKAIGNRHGQMLRMSLSYDITFLSVFLHAVMGENPVISKERCVLHPLRSREMVARDELMLVAADVGAILTYYKLRDNVYDGGGLSGLAAAMVSKKNRRASARLTGVEAAVISGYEALRALERQNCADVERVADCFATLLKQVVRAVVGEKTTRYTEEFSYQLGKWIYLIDALDDYDADVKRSNYNPFRALYGAESKAALIDQHGEDISQLFWLTLGVLKENYDKIQLLCSEGVLTNTVYYGLPMMTNRVLRREKCKKIRL